MQKDNLRTKEDENRKEVSSHNHIPSHGILLIHLLDQCNLRCKHCYMDSLNNSTTFLPKNIVNRTLKEIDDIEELGVKSVLLSGGEPFLYPYLSEILNSLPLNRRYEVRIITNGTMINETEVALLKQCNASLQVSIDGPPEFHDEFRGMKGAFEKTSSGIERAVNKGVSISLLTTVCQDNYAYIPWIAEWAITRSIKNIKIQPLSKMGRGLALKNKKLSEPQMCDLFFLLSDLAVRYRSKGLQFTLGYQTRQFLLAHPCAANACIGDKCHRKISREIKQLVIREDGTVLPEISTINYKFALGNVKERTLKQMVPAYFAGKYEEFFQFCRETYDQIMPSWPYIFVPWDEIIAEKSDTLL